MNKFGFRIIVPDYGDVVAKRLFVSPPPSLLFVIVRNYKGPFKRAHNHDVDVVDSHRFAVTVDSGEKSEIHSSSSRAVDHLVSRTQR